MNKILIVTVAVFLPFAAVAADSQQQDAENAARARNELYCNTLSKVITSQRNNAEDQIASAATQASLLNIENATLRDKIAAMEKQITDLKAELERSRPAAGEQSQDKPN